MRVKVHQDIEGVKSGQTVDVPKDRAEWLLAEGYASMASKPQDPGHGPATVEAKKDPRLADNVEQSPNKGLYDQIDEDRLGVHSEVDNDADPVGPPALDNPNPIERTNAKGDPEKGAEGKAELEEKAVERTASTEAAEEQA